MDILELVVVVKVVVVERLEVIMVLVAMGQVVGLVLVLAMGSAIKLAPHLRVLRAMVVGKERVKMVGPEVAKDADPDMVM